MVSKVGKKRLMELIAPYSNPYQKAEVPASCKGCSHFKEVMENSAFRGSFDSCSGCPQRIKCINYVAHLDKQGRFKNSTDAFSHYKQKLGDSELVRESANRSSLLVFLALHLNNHSSYGVVADISVRQLARECSITYKSAHAALEWLEKNGYISIAAKKTSYRYRYGYMDIRLENYTDYFKSAKEGGAGYIHFNRELFDKLVGLGRDINALRMNLWLITKADNKTEITDKVFKTGLDETKRIFPKYMTPSIFNKIFSSTGLFNASFTDNRQISYQYRHSAFNLRAFLNGEKEKAFSVVNGHLDSLKNAVQSVSRGIVPTKDDEEMHSLVDELYGQYKDLPAIEHISLKKERISDVVELCIEYPQDIVLRVLTESFFKPLFLNKKERSSYIKNLGAYLRESVKGILFKQNFEEINA